MLPDALTTDPRPAAPPREPRVVFAPGEPGGTLVVEPAFAELFARAGLTTAGAFLGMPGEVVTGHPDRHVARVEIPGAGRAFYLKRQHVVGWREKWRNRRVGFGWASRCAREAILLQELCAAGLPAPRWAAFGTHGRRAFLLLEEVPGAVELRRLLSDGALARSDRRQLAENIGRAVAAVHAAGFTTPDLTAKHVLVDPETLAVTFLDWQSAVRGRAVSAAERADALGALHASLAEGLASRADRARALRAYLSLTSPLEGEVAAWLGTRGVGGEPDANRKTSDSTGDAQDSLGSPSPPTRSAARSDLPLQGGGQRQTRAARAAVAPLIRKAAVRHAERRSVRDQLQPLPATDPYRLVWLAGEAVCATPEAAAAWPKPAIAPPFYGFGSEGAAPVRFAGRDAVLVRGHATAPLGRLRAWFRATTWRSPGVTAGRVLFHLDRYGVPAPKLLAFGQRLTGAIGAEWFALYEAPRGVLLRRWRRTAARAEQRKLLGAVAACLQKLHDAGCVLLDPRAALAVGPDGSVSVADPFAVRIVRRVTDDLRHRDRRAMAQLLGAE